MVIHQYLNGIKAFFHSQECLEEQCQCLINDERVLDILNKLLKDKVLEWFISNTRDFGTSLDLSEFYFSYTDNKHNEITLNIPKSIRDKIKRLIKRDFLTINIFFSD